MTLSLSSPAALAIEPERAALLVVDIQERLGKAMPQDVLEKVEGNIAILCEMARQFAMPIVVSEQYPKGLGKSTAAIEEAVAGDGSLLHRFEKTEFGVGAAPEFAPIWDELDRQQWIVTGMECHVCVYQTVRQLVLRQATVHVPRDAVLSRVKANWRVGAGLIERAGGIITSTEAVVFDVLGRSGTEEFKALSRMVR